MTSQEIRVAACHVSPVFLDASKTTEKAIALIKQAAANKAKLIVFPETYLPAFPIWSALQAPHQNHEFFHRMVCESVHFDGNEIKAIRDAAKQYRVLVNLGFSEKSRHSTATLYNSNILIGLEGEILVHHRKLMPTFFEKLTWSPGDGHGLQVSHTEYGNIGTLICGENTNPLARYALMTQSEQVHISTWPAKWPTQVEAGRYKASGSPDQTSADSESSDARAPTSKRTNYDNVAANRIRGAAHCFEAKCFGVLSAGLLDAECVEVVASGCVNPATIRAQLSKAPQAASMFLDPTGSLVPAFTIDASGRQKQVDYLQDEPGILYADLDLELCVEGKQYHDVTGGYQRLDVFELRVDRRRRDPASFVD